MLFRSGADAARHAKLMEEIAELGVVVTEVCPGPVATEFAQHAANRTGVSSPGALRIDAGTCADDALQGFRRGQPVGVG